MWKEGRVGKIRRNLILKKKLNLYRKECDTICTHFFNSLHLHRKTAKMVPDIFVGQAIPGYLSEVKSRAGLIENSRVSSLFRGIIF